MSELHQLIWKHRRHLFHQLWGPSLLFGFYCFLAGAVETHVLNQDYRIGAPLQAVVAFLLGMMLSFRTNTAYDRWWEGRKLWGQLVNRLRGLALKVRTQVSLTGPEREEFARLVAGFAYATRDRLRYDQAKLQVVPGFEHDPEAPGHVPVALARRIYERFASWRAAGRIDGFAYQSLDLEATALMDVLGGCERIKSTPLVHSYRISIHHLIVAYLVALPWTLENVPWSPGVAFVAAWFLLGVEMVAADIEDPFGREPDDLPLDTICANIERVTREVLVQGAEEPVYSS